MHFRADDQAALNNGNGAAQWEEVTNWLGAGAVAPLMKTFSEDGKTYAAPHFVTHGFTRADGTARPGVRFALNEQATGRQAAKMALVSDPILLGITGTESTWFFAFNAITNSYVNTNWKSYWGMTDASGRAWYYGLADRGGTYAWGGASVLGSSFVVQFKVGEGTYLVDLRDRYKKGISVGYINGTRYNSADWVETAAEPSTPGRFALGMAYFALSSGDDTAPMDMGELAIYNRALNDAECMIVREALTARWGLPTANTLYNGAAAGYCDELVGIGSSTETGSGKIAGVVETSGSSDGLTLSTASGALDGQDGYVFAAHDGGPAALALDAALARHRSGRTWRIESTFATAPAVTLTFDLAGLGLDALPAAELATATLVRKPDGAASFAVVPGAAASTGEGTVSFAFPAGTLSGGAYTLAFVSSTAAGTAVSLPSEGLRVHFRADDLAALNNGSGATQWEEVTNWQGGGAVAPLLKRVVAPNGSLRNVPHFVTNGFTRADGTSVPALRFCANEAGTGKASAVSVLASDALPFGFTGTDCTWFFAFDGIPNSAVNLNSKQYWGMANSSAIGWYLGLATRNNNAGKSVFYAWGGADALGSSLIASSVDVTAGKRLIDVRGRNKKAIATGYMNGERSTAFDWVVTLPQPVDCRLAFGNANDSLEGDVWSAAPMDVGELALYNRALNDAECMIVREALTARWGLPTANTLYTGAAAGYCNDLVGVGSSTETGKGYVPGAVATSARCRELSLAVTAGALDGQDGFVFAAGCAGGGSANVLRDEDLHMRRLENTWRIEKAALADWPDLALSFDLSAYAIASRVAAKPAHAVLLKDAGGVFEPVAGAAAVFDAATRVLSFGCPSGVLSDGVYTVGVTDDTGMAILVR